MTRIFHTIVEGIRELDTNKNQLRKFGFLLGGIVLVATIALVVVWEKNVHIAIPVIGGALVVLGLFFPRLLLWPYYLWMGLAIVLGSIISPIFLTVLFFGFLTPIGLLKRLFSRPNKGGAVSYWLPHEGSQDPKRMEELF